MERDMKKLRSDVSLQLSHQLEKSTPYAKQELIRKLVDQLPDDFVFCLRIAYDFTETKEESK